MEKPSPKSKTIANKYPSAHTWAVQYVKFIGDFDALLSGVYEREIIKKVLNKKNKFLLINKGTNFIEIELKIEDALHYFYVLEHQIEYII